MAATHTTDQRAANLPFDGYIGQALAVVEATPDERARALARLEQFPRDSDRPAAGPRLIRRRLARVPASHAQPPAIVAN